ncbi:hypothetical protein [Flavobacteriaceae bacterium 14752]|uniref:hypothetical protein n=1 Tax=Mesohalobacter salilacus TaxID=2491711 RepID=UPI000F63FB74|nr:hypothetical protein EIG84_00660 [Flavobacteriaceae bacterium 14752]
MPTLNSHTHCQATQTSRTSQSLSISVSEPTHGRKKSTIAQHCIRAIAGEVVKSRSVHLINFGGGGQVIALKSATALILDRCSTLKTYETENNIWTDYYIYYWMWS